MSDIVELEIYEWQDSDSGVWSYGAWCGEFPNLKGRGDSKWEAIEHLAQQIINIQYVIEYENVGIDQ